TDDGFNTTFNFKNIVNPTNPFTINGKDPLSPPPPDPSAEVADKVIVNGTNNSDFILVDSINRNVWVENAAGRDLEPVHLGATVEAVQVNGRLGTDTFFVVPTTAAATGTGGALTPPLVPINLQIDIEGGPTASTDSLVVGGNYTLGTAPNPVFSSTVPPA